LTEVPPSSSLIPASSPLPLPFQEEIVLELSQIKLRFDARGSQLTTFAIGGAIECLVDVEDFDELQKAINFANAHKLKWRIIGYGSNLLINDNSLSGIIIRLARGFKNCTFNGAQLKVGGAASLVTLSRSTAQQGLSGLEFAAGIPASLGGALYMNAGAHGGEISNCLVAATVFHDMQQVRLTAAELNFSYRHAHLPKDAIVLEVELALKEAHPADVIKRREECLNYRKETQPLTLPSAGSIFKNPINSPSPAGKLIEELGLKGRREGGAEISELHANWIVNRERKATAKDVKSLIAFVKESAKERHGIELVSEVINW
jgi:UDP-N-acetylmuramate dehydrogenase